MFPWAWHGGSEEKTVTDHHDPAADGAGTVPGGVAAGRVSPVVGGDGCFEWEGRPHVLRMELPVSAEEMVAALYGERRALENGGLDDTVAAWQRIAIVIAFDGLDAVAEAADQILLHEVRGTLLGSEWLAVCRRWVSEMTGEQVRPHRLAP
jgi:hypothetical protein